jgi:cell shape-determining protein MreC
MLTINNRKKGGKIRAVWIALFLSVLIWGFSYLFPSFFGETAHLFDRPVVAVRGLLGGVFYAPINFFKNKNNLLKENDGLKMKLSEAEEKIAMLEIQENENKELGEIVGGKDSPDKIFGRILSKPPITSYDTIVVDLGTESGIENGDKVVSAEGFSIGEVKRVFKDTSLVSLYSSGGNSINVLIGGDKIPGIASGKGGGSFVITLPKNSEVREGDIVRMAETGGILGSVGKIFSGEEDSFDEVFVQSGVSVFKIPAVYIHVSGENNI